MTCRQPGFTENLPSSQPPYPDPALSSITAGGTTTNIQIIQWGVNVAMGIMFAICFITGLLKLTLLLRLTGLNMVVLPSALISDLHDWSGIALGVLICLHLFLNRHWIISMTSDILHGTLRKI